MKVVALNERVIVKPIDNNDEKVGSFYIPDTAKERPQIGEVVSYGEKVLGLHVGDKVCYGKFSGTTVKVDDQELLMLNQDEVMARLED